MKNVFIGLMCILLVVDLVDRMAEPHPLLSAQLLNLAVLVFGLIALFWS